MSQEDPTNLITAIADELLKRGWWLATAESCTGGMIAETLTAVPGSSRWFAGGVVSYTVPWKERLLGVPSETIERFGVVSEETARAMVAGLGRLGAQAGMAITGIAGPTGAEPGKPVGTVCIAAMAGDHMLARTCHFPGGRDEVRRAATRRALEMLEGMLRGKSHRGTDELALV
ncbi:MAG: CinA family protein [Victivallales bacterium]|nr:CinA family protein [Victivallales bacterium]